MFVPFIAVFLSFGFCITSIRMTEQSSNSAPYMQVAAQKRRGKLSKDEKTTQFDFKFGLRARKTTHQVNKETTHIVILYFVYISISFFIHPLQYKHSPSVSLILLCGSILHLFPFLYTYLSFFFLFNLSCMRILEFI